MDKQVTGAKALLDILDHVGINEIFGYPGSAVMLLFDEIFQHKNITHYLVRHEQSAAHAAEAYGKVNNTIGCCLTTSGPGATNLVTGITNAYMDSNPLLCITGQVPQATIGKMSFQEVDIVSIVKVITKKAVQMSDANDFPKVLHELITLATTGRKGPVLIDIPKDVFSQKVDGDKLLEEYINLEKKHKQKEYPVKQSDIDELLKYLKESKKPVFLIGGGVIKANCEKEIEQIVKYFQVPVVATLHGLGVAGNTDYHYGMAGMHGSVIANKALNNADLIVSFGSRFDERLVGNNNQFAIYSKKVHIDIDKTELGKNVKTNLKIHTDLKLFLKELVKQPLEIDVQSWLLQLSQFRKEIENPRIENPNDSIHPKQVYDEINKIRKDLYFVTDVGQNQMWSAQYLKLRKGNHYISSGSLGTMGFGLPGAIGASIAKKNKTVVSIVGDGGLQMTIQEFILLKQYNLNVKVFIFNNQRLGMVKQLQDLFCNQRYISTTLDPNPNFGLIAKAYNLFYLKIEKQDDLSKIKSVFSSNEPMIIEINIDSTQNVLPMIPSNESFEEIII